MADASSSGKHVGVSVKLGATDACLAIDKQLKAEVLGNSPPRAIKVVVDVAAERLMSERSVPEGNSLDADFESVASLLEDAIPCLVLVRLEAHNEWAMLAWTPLGSPAKLNMLCASSRRTLRDEFSKLSFKEYFVTERSEVTLAQFAESTRERSDADRTAAMTQDEIDAAEGRRAVEQERASAPKMLAGLVALQVKMQPSFEAAMVSVVAMCNAPDCSVAVLARLGGRTGEELHGEVLEGASKPEDLCGKLPADEPAYVLLPQQVPGRSGEEPPVSFLLVSWLPDGASVTKRMKSSTFKASVVEKVKELSQGVSLGPLLSVEITGEDELTSGLVVSAAASSKASPLEPAADAPHNESHAAPGGRPAGGIALPGLGAAGLQELKLRAAKQASPQEEKPEVDNEKERQAEEEERRRKEAEDKADEQRRQKEAADASAEEDKKRHREQEELEAAQKQQKQAAPEVAAPASAVPTSAAPATAAGTHSLHDLQTAEIWQALGVVSTDRETYLPADVFMSLFGVGKDEFAKMPKWKKDQQKKQHGLF